MTSKKRIVKLGKTFRCLDLQRVQLVEDFPEEQKYRITLVSGVAVNVPYSLMHIDDFERMYLEYYDGVADDGEWFPVTGLERPVEGNVLIDLMWEDGDVRLATHVDYWEWYKEGLTHWRLAK